VTTTVGAEGIPDAVSVMNIADSAEEFASCVVKLNAGDSSALSKMELYPDWLNVNFGKANATRILLEDFGAPCDTWRYMAIHGDRGVEGGRE
jgi:hypothetical protein